MSSASYSYSDSGEGSQSYTPSYSYSNSQSKSPSYSYSGSTDASKKSDKSGSGSGSSYNYSYSESNENGTNDKAEDSASYTPSYSYSYTPSEGKDGKASRSGSYSGSYSYSAYGSYSYSGYSGYSGYSQEGYSYTGYHDDSYAYYSSQLPPIRLIVKPTNTRIKGLRTGKFLRLIDEDPCALTFCDFALYLTSENDPDRAERYFKRALHAEPYDVRSLASYALFLEQVRHNYDAAHRIYELAIETPRRKKKHAALYNNYAVFLKNTRSNFADAERFYKKAIKIHPTHSNSLGNYGLFHKKITRDYERALFYMLRASEVAEFVEDRDLWARRHDRLVYELQRAAK